MPLYEYECTDKDCITDHASFEVRQSINDDPLVVCPECGKPTLKKVIAGGTSHKWTNTRWTGRE